MFDDEKKVICSKGKIYKYYQPTDFEDQCGICLWIESEINTKVPITVKIFDKFFTTLDEMRNNKINEILK
jgi:hypothetical protein